MRKKSKQAGFNGRFTNHSGKVTCATQSFEENVDEQLIKLQTGHHSDAVCAYKCPTKSHALHVSNILQPPLAKKAAKAPEMEVFGGYQNGLRLLITCGQSCMTSTLVISG